MAALRLRRPWSTTTSARNEVVRDKKASHAYANVAGISPTSEVESEGEARMAGSSSRESRIPFARVKDRDSNGKAGDSDKKGPAGGGGGEGSRPSSLKSSASKRFRRRDQSKNARRTHFTIPSSPTGSEHGEVCAHDEEQQQPHGPFGDENASRGSHDVDERSGRDSQSTGSMDGEVSESKRKNARSKRDKLKMKKTTGEQVDGKAAESTDDGKTGKKMKGLSLPKFGRKKSTGYEGPEGSPEKPKKRIKESSAQKTMRQANKVAATVRLLIIGESPSEQIATGQAKDTEKKLVNRLIPNSASSPAAKTVSGKELNQLKAALANPDEATHVISVLKSAELPSGSDTPSNGVRLSSPKGVCLECTDEEAMVRHCEHIRKMSQVSDDSADKFLALNRVERSSSDVDENKDVRGVGSAEMKNKDREGMNGNELLSGKFGLLRASAFGGIPSAGTVLGDFVNSAGAFDALAGVSARLIQSTGSHKSLVSPPDDRLSVLVYWWGYEVALPQASIKYLTSVHSVSATLFTFLHALVLSGGAPELAPFVRYISTYVDMEWKGIQAQNQGKGVVLAATWILPVAVIPRPWDLDPRVTAV